MGKEVIHDVDENEFYSCLPVLRKAAGDRAVLRAIHIFDENRRVLTQINALKNGRFDEFLNYVNLSGQSSWDLLQNVTPCGNAFHQDMAFAITLCKRLLGENGAVRVHGGGFAGTCLAFVKNEALTGFVEGVEKVLGRGACHVLHIV